MSAQSVQGADPLLSVQGLHAHYGKSHILHGVDFHVGQAEVVSLLGRNGSGRSTTLRLFPLEAQELGPKVLSPKVVLSVFLI